MFRMVSVSLVASEALIVLSRANSETPLRLDLVYCRSEISMARIGSFSAVACFPWLAVEWFDCSTGFKLEPACGHMIWVLCVIFVLY